MEEKKAPKQYGLGGLKGGGRATEYGAPPTCTQQQQAPAHPKYARPTFSTAQQSTTPNSRKPIAVTLLRPAGSAVPVGGGPPGALFAEATTRYLTV